MDLINAVKNNDLEHVKLLVEQGADKDKGDIAGQSPLWMASAKGHLEVAQYLAEQGADLDKANIGGTTPLTIAAANGHHCNATCWNKVPIGTRPGMTARLPSTGLVTMVIWRSRCCS